MKCSICGEDGCFSIPHYRSAKTHIVDSYEYRCKKHAKLGRRIDRKLFIAKKNGVLDSEILKLFPKPVVIEPEPVIKSTPSTNTENKKGFWSRIWG